MPTMEQKLAMYNQFKRVSKSFIISANHLKKVNGSTLLLTNDLEVTISKNFNNKFKLH